MKKSIFPGAASLLLYCLCATAQTVTPMKGQSADMTQQDVAACQSQAGGTGNAAPQSGGRARGAATGAVAGATVAGVRSNQHEELSDRVDDDVKQDYRCLLYTSPSPRDQRGSRMPSSA